MFVKIFRQRLEFFLNQYFVGQKTLTLFTRHLAILTNAGIPLTRGLRILSEQEDNFFLRKALAQLIHSLENGLSLSASLSRHPELFDTLYVSMVRAAELSGTLHQSLTHLSQYQERTLRIRNKLISVMIYPVTVLVLSILTLIFLMTAVVPKFENIFDELFSQQKLPMLTQFVLNFSHLIQNHLIAILSIMILIPIFFEILHFSRRGRMWIDRVLFKIPVIGHFALKVVMARFCRTLGSLLGSGVPLLHSLNAAKDTCGNAWLSKSISRIHESVKHGELLHTPMQADTLFSSMVTGMVQIGQETGDLPHMLDQIADIYDEEIDLFVASISSILEPFLIIVLAVLISIIVIALFLPILTMITQLSLYN